MAKTSRKCALHPVPPLDVRCDCHAPVGSPDSFDSGSRSPAREPAQAPFIRFLLLTSVATVTLRCALLTALTRGSERRTSTRPGTLHPLPPLCRRWVHRDSASALDALAPGAGLACIARAGSRGTHATPRLVSNARCISVDFEQKCSAPPPWPSGSNARSDCNDSDAVVRDPVWQGGSVRGGGNLCPISPGGTRHRASAGVDSEMDGR